MTRRSVQRPPSDQREPPASLSAQTPAPHAYFFFDVIKSVLFHLSPSQTGAHDIGTTSI